MALAACSSDPPRCGEDGTSCADAGMPLDRPDVDVVQMVDLGADLGAVLIDDPPASRDLPDLVDVQVVDAGADAGLDVPQDVPGVDVAVDVQLVDVGTDAGALDSGTDAGEMVDVRPVDVVSDRVDVVDVVDVPGDAGPVDGGPVVYDLEAVRAGAEYVVSLRQFYPSGSSSNCVSAPTVTSCSVTGGVLAFSIRACGVYLTGDFDTAATRPGSLSIFAGGGGSFAPTLRLESGRRTAGGPARRSFHVQAAASPFQGEPGISGIPGRTVDPALGDIWLLGCPSD